MLFCMMAVPKKTDVNNMYRQGRTKINRRTKGARNKMNMFNQGTLYQVKAIIAFPVAKDDVEASKLATEPTKDESEIE